MASPLRLCERLTSSLRRRFSQRRKGCEGRPSAYFFSRAVFIQSADVDALVGLHHLSEFARRILRRHVIDTDPLAENQVAAEISGGY